MISGRERRRMAAIDDSCRRPGSIPFKWEVCPGTPKHVRSSSATVVPSTYASISKVAVAPKLTPPPSMAPSPYHSPRASYYSARSASVSPSRRRPHRPTAFLDVAPRSCAATAAAAYGAGDDEAETAAYRCFPLPVFRRKDGKKGGGGGGSGRRSGGSSSSSGSSFRSEGAAAPAPGGGLRRSASSSSSSCLSLSSGSSSKFAEAREVETAAGWFF